MITLKTAMPKYGAGYSTEPHGEMVWEEWEECEYCGHRWTFPQDACDCELLLELESKEPPKEFTK